MHNVQPKILIVDKPQNSSSSKIVLNIKKELKFRKIGHSGTLDPMSTGLLILACNKATKLLPYLKKFYKSYYATIRLGQSTSTDDANGILIQQASYKNINILNKNLIEKKLKKFKGFIYQTPNKVSAIKLNGQRSYKKFINKEKIFLDSRLIEIKKIILKKIDNYRDCIDLHLYITCSSGTYIRAIARDLGSILKVGGHLTKLKRESIGPFCVKNIKNQNIHSHLFIKYIKLNKFIKYLFPVIQLNCKESLRIQYGQNITLKKKILYYRLNYKCKVAIFNKRKILIAIGLKFSNLLHPIIVFNE